MRRVALTSLVLLGAGCGPEVRTLGSTDANVMEGLASALLATDASAPSGARPLFLSSAGFNTRADEGLGVHAAGTFLPIRFEGGRVWVGLGDSKLVPWVLQDGSILLVPVEKTFCVVPPQGGQYDLRVVPRLTLQAATERATDE